MKITKSQLNQIIKEEISKILNEANWWEKKERPKVVPEDDPGAWARTWTDDQGVKHPRSPVPEDDPFARPWHSSKKSDPFDKSGRTWEPDPRGLRSDEEEEPTVYGEPQEGEVGGDVPDDVTSVIFYAHPTGKSELDGKIKKIRDDGTYEVWRYVYGR